MHFRDTFRGRPHLRLAHPFLGPTLTIVKTQPGVGVSGTEMPGAILSSIAAAAATTERVQFV